MAELSETAKPDIDETVSDETMNEEGEVSLDEVSEAENQVNDVESEQQDS